jgi:uncharacterized membrane protein
MSPRSRLALIVVITVVACGVLVVGGVAGYVVWAQRKISRDVSYEVTGTARPKQISYVSKEDPYRQTTAESSTLPWSVRFHTETLTAKAGVTVMLAEEETGTATCTLRVDGKVVATETSNSSSRLVMCFEPG